MDADLNALERSFFGRPFEYSVWLDLGTISLFPEN